MYNIYCFRAMCTSNDCAISIFTCHAIKIDKRTLTWVVSERNIQHGGWFIVVASRPENCWKCFLKYQVRSL